MTKVILLVDGTIKIPKDLRDRLDLQPGTKLAIEVQGDSLVLKRWVSELPNWRTMEGMAGSGESLTEALMEERAADKAHDEARIKGR